MGEGRGDQENPKGSSRASEGVPRPDRPHPASSRLASIGRRLLHSLVHLLVCSDMHGGLFGPHVHSAAPSHCRSECQDKVSRSRRFAIAAEVDAKMHPRVGSS